MSLLSFQEFLNGLDETLDPSPSPPPPLLRPRKPSPKFPEDVLSTIFDVFTSFDFHNLKIAVQVNSFLYNRYQPKLYRYISLKSNNVGDFQLHATLNLATSDTGLPPRRNRDRFLNLCHSITHLEIDDEEASQQIVQVLVSKDLRSSQTLFRKVEYLILRNGFLGFLQKIDYHAFDGSLHSKRVVQLLGRYLKPKHLCVENLRAYDKKNPKSPEIWKLEILKSHWNLDSMTFHHDIGSTRIIFTGVPLQKFFLAYLAGASPSVLMPSTEDNIGNDQTRVQIHQDSPDHTVGISVDLQRRIRGQDVMVFEDRSMGECVCCSSSRSRLEDVISIRR
ncbi:hypothetical protein L486_01966 [Kwoniella mangroviensis CBS 10435]|uniref:Uncharacterized protein n=1 Tax=Kwoniella mangroviensis CBS 10435 TaxID=1331196 RepID=A0A1B9J3E4_9TREE|nr:hypothetical protein L486_01966 [Kwoniella mangroviensis CBS 10435]